MTEILSVTNMRNSDAGAISGGVSGKELMARAGKAIFDNVEWKPPVAIVCGVGNNAGDGYVLASLMSDSGIECTLILLEDRFSVDGRHYFDICENKNRESKEKTGSENPKIQSLDEFEDLTGFGTVVDCIFGTGFKGEVKGKALHAIEMINNSGAYVVAVDINSGMNGDSGMCGMGDGSGICVHSDMTVSIGSFKPGHFLNMAKDVIKTKINCDIGIEPIEKPFSLITEAGIKEFFSERPDFSNKGTYGYIAIMGGSKRYSGAVRLAAMANAAMRSGAGVVKVAIPDGLYHDLLPLILESTVFSLSDDDGDIVFKEEEIKELTSNVKTVAFGMGMGAGRETTKCLEYLLREYSGTLIIDADGLNVLSCMDRELLRHSKCRTVLTPHIREFERLTGLSKEEILSEPVKKAENYALDTGAVVLLKGPSTIVTDGVRTYLTDAGCAGMATAGSGDVLSGILSAICAYMPGIISKKTGAGIPDLTLATAIGAYINGKAGESAQRKTNSYSMTAGDTVQCIAEVISGLLG